jgi:hypothetical protein
MTLTDARAAQRKAIEDAYAAWVLENAEGSLDGYAYKAFRAGWIAAGMRSTLPDRVGAVDAARAEHARTERIHEARGGNR